MKVRLAYGKKGLEVDVPDKNLVKVMSMNKTVPLSQPEISLAEALDNPIDSKSLEDLVKGSRNACIAICDITRPVPNSLLLSPVLEKFEAVNISRSDITILIATGLHRPSTESELIQLVGKEIRHAYRIVDHHARFEEEHRFLGTTSLETPVWIDRRYCDADFKMTIASIEPHLMAGFSGGRKMVAPGCAGVETIKALHSPKLLEDPRCREGNLEGNPLHKEMTAIAKMAGHDFIVNVAMDEKLRITGIFAGSPEGAFEAGVAHVREAVKSTINRPVDIVVTTAAGYPLDLTYYQAIKGMTAAMSIVKRGGTLILAAECTEGLGNEEFRRMATSFTSPASFRDWILSNSVAIDQWQLEECAKAALWANVILVCDGISEAERRRLFVNTASDVQAVLNNALVRHGTDATVAVMPKGPYTLAQVE